MKKNILIFSLILLGITGCKSNQNYQTKDNSPGVYINASNKFQSLQYAQINLSKNGYGSSIIGNNILSLKLKGFKKGKYTRTKNNKFSNYIQGEYDNTTLIIEITLKQNKFRKNSLETEVIGKKFKNKYEEIPLTNKDIQILNNIHEIAFGVKPKHPLT